MLLTHAPLQHRCAAFSVLCLAKCCTLGAAPRISSSPSTTKMLANQDASLQGKFRPCAGEKGEGVSKRNQHRGKGGGGASPRGGDGGEQ